MKNTLFRYLVLLLLTAGIYGCDKSENKSVSETPEKKEEKRIDVPEFNADQAYQFVEKQLSFGPRVPNTMPHKECREYLVQTLANYGAKIQQQEFQMNAYDGTPLFLTNIIASFNPQQKKRILLAAHWDTRPIADKDQSRQDEPIPGANDGASGVAVLLEIARVISEQEGPQVGVDMIFFDGEDYGAPANYAGNLPWGGGYCLGSQYWAKNKHRANYSAYYGILLDMVGAQNAQFYQEGNSRYFAPKIVRKVWNQANKLGYGQYFVYADSPGITDDHVPVNQYAGIPMIDIIPFDPGEPDAYFPDYHHTHKDDLTIIDKNTLKAVGQTVLHILYSE